MLVAQAAEFIRSSCIGRSGSVGVVAAEHVQQSVHLPNCLLLFGGRTHFYFRFFFFVCFVHRLCCPPLVVNTQQLIATCNTAVIMEILTVECLS